MVAINPYWERCTTPRTCEAGEPVFLEGDSGDEVYIIASGEVVISKATPDGEPLVLGTRGPGDLIGEIALIHDETRTASAVATQPTTLMAISSANFWSLMRSDDQFRQVVMETLITHLLQADQSRMVAEMWERDLERRFTSLSGEHERMTELMRLRQETSRFIVHDLRNPLQIAMTALSMIEMEPDYNPNNDTARFVLMAQGGLQRMLNLVDALLDVGRLESGADTLELRPVNLEEIITRCVATSQPMTHAAGTTLRSDLPDGALPVIAADGTRIERVIMNLIDNAIRFTPRGEVVVRAWADGESVWVAVDDTGAGIPAEERERIFDRFVQTESGRRSTGFGLGLAFCRSAIQAHGGEIRAEDGPEGRGTRMIFSLPLERTPALRA